jgi:hypothetical protein
VSVVFHSAATVKMDEQVRAAAELNVLGVLHVLQLADTLPALAVRTRTTHLCHVYRINGPGLDGILLGLNQYLCLHHFCLSQWVDCLR